MVQYNYSTAMNENRARAVIRDVPISYKIAVLISRRIKGMPAEKAIRFLKNVQAKKEAIPYTTFNDSVGHKPGVGPGRYPEKAAKLFEGLVANAVSNAEDKGLGKEVVIELIVPQRASQPYHYGRLGRRKFKRSHVELVVTNAMPEQKKQHSKKPYKGGKR